MTTHSHALRAPMSRRGPAAMAFVGQTLAWAVMLAAAAILAASVVVPRLAGATGYAVVSSSMTPTYPVGSLVVTRAADPSTLEIGDVITFQLRSGRPTVATHRIVGIGVNADGDRIFRTKGDANPSPDPHWVQQAQVRGTVWYGVPYVGYAWHLLGSARGLIVDGAVVALLGYAAVQLAGAAKDRRRSKAASQ